MGPDMDTDHDVCIDANLEALFIAELDRVEREITAKKNNRLDANFNTMLFPEFDNAEANEDAMFVAELERVERERNLKIEAMKNGCIHIHHKNDNCTHTPRRAVGKTHNHFWRPCTVTGKRSVINKDTKKSEDTQKGRAKANSTRIRYPRINYPGLEILTDTEKRDAIARAIRRSKDAQMARAVRHRKYLERCAMELKKKNAF